MQIHKYLQNHLLMDMMDLRNLRGRFRVEHHRKNQLLDIYDIDNGIVNVGKDKILNVMFNGDTQIANNSWFIGLIDNSGFSALAAGDTMASHAGWTEYQTYNQTTRVAWGSGTSTTQSTTNASPAQFDINATGNVYGVFVVSNSTKGGTSGILWATANFTSVVPVSSGDQLRCTYTVSA